MGRGTDEGYRPQGAMSTRRATLAGSAGPDKNRPCRCQIPLGNGFVNPYHYPMTSPHPPLSPDLRNQLAKVVITARSVAEAAARHALEALAVNRSAPHQAMPLSEQGLRNRLRARGRQLGDHLDRRTRIQEIGRLGHEVAYEQWHRMLFARFLAENGLLLDPEHGVPVSTEECGELARVEGTDRWTVAGSFAAQMLPGVFRQHDPVLEVVLAPEARLELEELLESLPRAVFLAGDALGWTYQFWQASRKDEINQSGVKIGADELPAVTQLFTERYMVLFLFHNTIGAWRAAKTLTGNGGGREHESEEDIRRAVRIDAGEGYDFTHLRFVRDEDQAWRPAAGGFEGWPRTAAELRILDPCCGSGHFLVEGLELLVRLRMDEEGLSTEDAVRRVPAENLHGLEIDPRCTQIAAFNVAFTAWCLVGRPIELGRIKVACCGLAPNATTDKWMELADRGERALGLEGNRNLFGSEPSLATGPFREGVGALHRLFRDAPELGSLIDPARTLRADLFKTPFPAIRKALSAILEREKQHAEGFERAVAAQGMAGAVELLNGTYDLVVTNVPFLARGKQSNVLKQFADGYHSAAKGDLATIFASRIVGWLRKSGTQALVMPQNWLFLTSYREFREDLLTKRTWNFIARLGENAFDDVQAAGAFAILNILSSDTATNDWHMAGIDASAPHGQRPIRATEKDDILKGAGSVQLTLQAHQLKNPDGVIIVGDVLSGTSVDKVADCLHGLKTADDPRFKRYWWEISLVALNENDEPSRWRLAVQAPSGGDFSGASIVIRLADRHGSCTDLPSATIAGSTAWTRTGILIGRMRQLPSSLYVGSVFKHTSVVAVCKNRRTMVALWCCAKAGVLSATIRLFNQALAIDSGVIRKIPFDLDHWQKVAAEQYPNGLPEPYSDDPTQWLFHGHPCGSVVWAEDAKRLAHGPLRTDATVLQIAVARLLGYRWPAEHDPNLRLADESRTWVERCRQLDRFADSDGIVCIPAVGGERPAQDRLRELLRAAYEPHWSVGTERTLLAAVQDTGRDPASIDDWLRDFFFKQHCKLFHNRPFVWHVWDGRRDGFHALVNYHRLAGPGGDGRRTLESLAYRYLGNWIDRQRDEQREGKAGSDARLAAALGLQQQLERILLGEPPLDVFVRWRPLHQQPIGWEPELDDGVRLNIRPFMRAQLPFGGRKGAGVLRWKPNVKWGKDRGKEPERHKETDEAIRPREDFPWFWNCPGAGAEEERTDFPGGPAFDGNRWNDLHYTQAAKEEARAREARADATKAAREKKDARARDEQAGDAGRPEHSPQAAASQPPLEAAP